MDIDINIVKLFYLDNTFSYGNVHRTQQLVYKCAKKTK